jgi:hypothetical protein
MIYVTTSWDDGHKLDMKLAVLLKKYGIKGTFYICPNEWQKLENVFSYIAKNNYAIHQTNTEILNNY